ncbi:MAG: OmpA family protein [Deltaproteobacteria bacterium]|nr:OmpA family protein [Deltaproteobacteria bacterium]
MRFSLVGSLGLALVSLFATACGYSEEEWRAQLDKYARLVAQSDATKKQLAETEAQLRDARERSEKLQRDLESMGVDLQKLGADLDSRNVEVGKLAATQRDLEAALFEYTARAEALERIKKRFEQLREKLEALTTLGLSVSIRNNRMMISLPGDVLFDTGKDSLKSEGERILDKVAQIINGDASLRGRFYQVAGHTDNEPLAGGPFRDNWGLSMMRARTVLLHLIDPKKGALPDKRWSASGYADTDPLVLNDSAEGRKKNRRCELVVVPNAEEMLDLKNITQ